MSISGDYATPQYVNGYACWNCAAVAEAKKDINPADPKAGPGGVDASNDPTANSGGTQQTTDQGSTQGSTQTPAVLFGGVLSGSTAALASSQSAQFASTNWGLGGRLNISA
jgi:hypothetical protein